jgi:tetratricopeptide (TPR) repeat protein
MRNMAKSFTYLDNSIFPKLRRAEIKVTYETIGHSDETYLVIAKTNPEKLGVEELLYAGSLQTDLAEKALIYTACEKLYPGDNRAFNNEGVLLFTQGKLAEAEAKFQKSLTIKESGISKNNLAAVTGVKGDWKKAKELLEKSNGAGVEGNYNKGIISIVQGNYSSAISSFGDSKTFNKALAQVLNKDFEAAIATINASSDVTSAQGHYLKAIAYAHQDKVDECVKALQASIAKDASFKAKMIRDREFLKFAANENFIAITK